MLETGSTIRDAKIAGRGDRQKIFPSSFLQVSTCGSLRFHFLLIIQTHHHHATILSHQIKLSLFNFFFIPKTKKGIVQSRTPSLLCFQLRYVAQTLLSQQTSTITFPVRLSSHPKYCFPFPASKNFGYFYKPLWPHFLCTSFLVPSRE